MYNSHVIIDDSGVIRHIYNKIHLFEVYLKDKNTVMREADFTTRGGEFPLPVDTPVGTMGTLTVNYKVLSKINAIQEILFYSVMTCDFHNKVHYYENLEPQF